MYDHICPRCNKKFRGRENKVYCGSSCKSIVNNKKKKEGNRIIDKDIKSLENNVKILNRLLDKEPNRGRLTKNLLINLGFDFEGPFRVLPSDVYGQVKLQAGNYILVSSVTGYDYFRVY